jgi:hypothetical protein
MDGWTDGCSVTETLVTTMTRAKLLRRDTLGLAIPVDNRGRGPCFTQ